MVNAASVTTLTGNNADVVTAYSAYSAGTISGLGNEAVTLADTSITAALITATDALTTGVVDASSVTTIASGTAAAANTLYAANAAGTVSGLGNEAVTISDTTLTATVINTLDG